MRKIGISNADAEIYAAALAVEGFDTFESLIDVTEEELGATFGLKLAHRRKSRENVFRGKIIGGF